MSIPADACKNKIDAVRESSAGMTLVNVMPVGTTGFFIGTPETARDCYAGDSVEGT